MDGFQTCFEGLEDTATHSASKFLYPFGQSIPASSPRYKFATKPETASSALTSPAKREEEVAKAIPPDQPNARNEE